MKTKITTIRIEEGVFSELDNVSKKNNLTKAAIVSSAIRLWLKEFEEKEEVFGELLGNQQSTVQA